MYEHIKRPTNKIILDHLSGVSFLFVDLDTRLLIFSAMYPLSDIYFSFRF